MAGVCAILSGIVHMKDPLLLIEKSSLYYIYWLQWVSSGYLYGPLHMSDAI